PASYLERDDAGHGATRAPRDQCTGRAARELSALTPAHTQWSAPGAVLLDLPHLVAGGDDRAARARAALDVALVHAVGGDEGDVEIAVAVGADDRLVVGRNRLGERLVGLRDRRGRTAPRQPALLAVHEVGHVDVAHARRRVGRLRAGMVRIVAKDD